MGWDDIPNLSGLVVERLRLNALDIMAFMGWQTGDPTVDSGRAFKLNPERDLIAEDLPVAFHMIGGTFQTSPANQGQYVEARYYYQRWFVYPFDSVSATSDGSMDRLSDLADVLTPVNLYYEANRRLRVYNTFDAGGPQADLNYCLGMYRSPGEGKVVMDNGIEPLQFRSGSYWGFTLEMPVVMSANKRADYLVPS
jgi:hypothetical protein